MKYIQISRLELREQNIITANNKLTPVYLCRPHLQLFAGKNLHDLNSVSHHQLFLKEKQHRQYNLIDPTPASPHKLFNYAVHPLQRHKRPEKRKIPTRGEQLYVHPLGKQMGIKVKCQTF
jgi:hypothetical protein